MTGGGSLTFIGNATCLLRLGPFTLLTDPNFLHAGQRAYLGYGLWSKRLEDPAMTVAELPALDAIVLSHLHGDHWDRVAQKELDRSVPVMTTARAARTLERRGFQSYGLATWQSRELASGAWTLRITALPGRHGPVGAHRLLPPVMGSMLELEDDGNVVLRVYVSGDTLCVPELAAVAARYRDIDVGVLHLGGTKLLRLLTVTMDGKQGATLVRTLQPRQVVPVHVDDYTVFTSPLEDFVSALGDDRGRLNVVGRGERAHSAGTLTDRTAAVPWAGPADRAAASASGRGRRACRARRCRCGPSSPPR